MTDKRVIDAIVDIRVSHLIKLCRFVWRTFCLFVLLVGCMFMFKGITDPDLGLLALGALIAIVPVYELKTSKLSSLIRLLK